MEELARPYGLASPIENVELDAVVGFRGGVSDDVGDAHRPRGRSDQSVPREAVTHVGWWVVVDGVVHEHAGREREVLGHVDREVVHVRAARRCDRRHGLREARRDRERSGPVQPLRDRGARERHELILRLPLRSLAVRPVTEHEPVIRGAVDLRAGDEGYFHDRVVSPHEPGGPQWLDPHVAVGVEREDLGPHAAVHHLDEVDERPLLAVHELDLRVAGEASEVPLSLDRWVTHREVLREPRDGLVDRHVAVRVVLPHHVADDRRRLAERAVAAKAHLVHRPEDPPLHRLQAVAHIREGARDDDGHRVIEVGLPHLGLELDTDDALVVRSVDHVAPCSLCLASAATASRTRANASSVREYRSSSSARRSSGIRRKSAVASASTSPSVPRVTVPFVSIPRPRSRSTTPVTTSSSPTGTGRLNVTVIFAVTPQTPWWKIAQPMVSSRRAVTTPPWSVPS